MAEKPNESKVDLKESSTYNRDNRQTAADQGDAATDELLDRLEAITGGADDPPIFEGELGHKLDELEAETDEQIDALEVDLLQEDEIPEPARGSGKIVDDVSEENLTRFTEVGPDAFDRGATSVVPGRENTSRTLRSHHPDTQSAQDDAIVEGNLDEPLDETRGDTDLDEDTGT
jgi:hypothetical protein